VDYGTLAARARLIAGDARPRVAICDERTAARVCDALAPVQLLVLRPGDSQAGAAAGPPVAVTAADRAYILYTSGSTGTPKGVCHSHASAMAFVRWAAAQAKLGSSDVVSQHASPSFDLSIFDFFCAAAAGAKLVPVPEWLLGRVGKLLRWIRDEGITVWYSVPSALLRDPDAPGFEALSESALRHVILAGERIPAAGLKRLAVHLRPDCVVSNWYGPTETNVCTFFDLCRQDIESSRPVPIGRACPYAEVRLGRGGSDGAPAELLVRSDSTMVGYWNDPELTARAFVEDEAGRRFYRTGDWVSQEGDDLVLHGRRDRMLKVRGYRIQPEEIEECLMQHPDVREAAAVAAGDAQISVAVTASGGVSADGLRRHCAARLPGYMLPVSIVAVEALPRTARGKVDYRRLPALIRG
jgi:amino acid adenylation domain-containing protein